MIAGALVRHRAWIAAAWAGAAALLTPAVGQLDHRLTVAARIPGSESAAVDALLRDEFESPMAESALLVIAPAPGPDTPQGRQLLTEIDQHVKRLPGVVRTSSWLDHADPTFLTAGSPGTFVVVGLAPGSEPERMVPALQSATAVLAARLQARHPGLELRWTGALPLNVDIRAASSEQTREAERRALPLTLLLLLLAFRTLGASGLALGAGVLSIAVSLGAASVVAAAYPLSILLRSIVSMLGLGLGVDYALLMISRFREFLEAGCTAEEAARRTAAKGGRTVVLSAATVAVGFLGLLAVPIAELRSVAVGGLLVVTVSALVATTLLPGMLAWLGHRIDFGGILRSRRSQPPAPWMRWGRAVVARPLVIVLVAGAPLLLLAKQALRLSDEIPEDTWLPEAMESVHAARDLQAMGHGGVVSTLRVVLMLPEGTSAFSASGWAATASVGRALLADPRVASVQSLPRLAGEEEDPARVSLLPSVVKRTFVSQTGEATLLQVIPREGLRNRDWIAFVRRLRSLDAAALAELPGCRLRVGGLAAHQTDYLHAVSGQLGRVMLLVLGGTQLALFLGFRSVLVPLKAVLLNLLSVGAALGALVLVFQEGHGGGLLGLPGPLEGMVPAVPLIVFCTVFGLSMDYEVFLVSRVAEAKREGHGDAEAIVLGLAHTGRLITSAAAIMTAVFGAFTLGRFVLVQMIGFTLAVAILLDATVVRLAVGPALLRLAGRWNWWPGSRSGAGTSLQMPTR